MRKPQAKAVKISEISLHLLSLSPNSLAKMDGRKIVYTKLLSDRDTFATPLKGVGNAAPDNVIEIENTSAGAAPRWHTDKAAKR